MHFLPSGVINVRLLDIYVGGRRTLAIHDMDQQGVYRPRRGRVMGVRKDLHALHHMRTMTNRGAITLGVVSFYECLLATREGHGIRNANKICQIVALTLRLVRLGNSNNICNVGSKEGVHFRVQCLGFLLERHCYKRLYLFFALYQALEETIDD